MHSVILNVDDNEPTRQAKSQGLRAAGFTVILPVRTSCAEDIGTVVPAGNPHVSGKADPGKTRDLNGVKVLVVDDDVDAREILATVLGQAGASVTKASNANEALEALSKSVPTLLLSDVGMPGNDGHAFVRELRLRDENIGGRIPAIALTAYARSDDRFRALASGFQMHVAKPVEVGELLDVVANLAKQAPLSIDQAKT